jgi:hypothetical protein
MARVAMLVLLTGALAACGGSDGDSAASDAPTTTAAPATTAAPTTTTPMHMDPAPTVCEVDAQLMAFVQHEGEQDLQVTLTEWKIDLSDSSPQAGETHFVVRNTGAEPHEMAIFKGTAASLPTAANGSVDEDALPAGAVIGRVAVPAGQDCDLEAVDLEPGTYTLVCNMVEGMAGQEPHIHYAEGMYKEITVS